MSRRMDHSSGTRHLLTFLILANLLYVCLAWPQSARDSDNFVYPSDSNDDATNFGVRSLTNPEPNCSWPLIWYPQTQQCEELLTTGPCEVNQWLVLGFQDVPQCHAMQCPDKQISYKGRCVDLKDTTRCPAGMQIVATEMGVGDCDCREGHVYWSNRRFGTQNICYALYQRGPCPQRQILYLPKENNALPMCRPNRCKAGEIDVVNQNGTLQLAWLGRIRGNCLPLDSQGPCEERKVVGVDKDTLAIACVVPLQLGFRALINAPVLNCNPGSKRDALGRCRRSMF